MTLSVALLSSDYVPNIGGIAAHVYHLARALRDAGARVVVVNPLVSDVSPLGGAHGEIAVLRLPHSTHSIRTLRVLDRALRTRRALLHAERIVGQLDVVHQHDYFASLPAARLRPGRSSWIWTNHSSTFLLDRRRPRRLQAARWGFAATSGIITVSEELKRETRAVWGSGKPIVYIPNGVDLQRFNEAVPANRDVFGLQPDDFVVLCPRRMVEKNGVIHLAAAIALVRAMRPRTNWRFVFLGSEATYGTDARYIEEVRDRLAPHIADGTARLLGNIPMDHMPSLNACADVVVLPSLIEAVSLSALEAMASCRAVVATNVGGLPEIIANDGTGLLVRPADSEHLASAIVTLADDPERRARLARAGHDLAVAKYGWPAIAAATLGFYESVLRQSR